jgi:predicted amidohydrolase
MTHKIDVAVVQGAVAYLDLPGALERTEVLTRRAAADGARLVVFGETWIGGYPAWLDHHPDVALWNHGPTKDLFARIRRSSLLVPGADTARLGRLARELGVVLVLGANERVDAGPGNGTIYNAMLVFDANGALVIHHRKLVPTHSERLIWGQGDAMGLHSHATAVGRLGGLICWEHWMPLARQALHVAGEQIHVALWPTVNDAHQLASRHYAFEGRCFVLAAGSLVSASDLPKELGPPRGVAPDALLLRGGSAILRPDGSYLVEPIYDREAILSAEIDLDEVDRERMTLDVSGHYSRPDVFGFSVTRHRPGEEEP